MKKILIIADGILAKNFLSRLFEAKSNSHHYIIIAQNKEIIDTQMNFEKFQLLSLRPYQLFKAKKRRGRVFQPVLYHHSKQSRRTGKLRKFTQDQHENRDSFYEYLGAR